MILFEAISRGEADRCLRGRDRRAVCLSERHVKPHLVIGDVAAGQWVDPSTRRSIHGAGRSRSLTIEAPKRAFSQVVAVLAPQVGLHPPCGTSTATTFSP
jgi:hypothetical protein